MQARQEIKQRLARFKEELKQSGVKATHQRLEIFREVIRSGEHPDVETVYRGVRRRIPSVSLDTVYRTLWLFLQRGLIDTLGPSQNRLRFDGNIRPHHHFICKKCSRVFDFTSREFDELIVPSEVKDWGSVERTHVEFKGLCAQCREKQGDQSPKNKF
ncbi:MAG: Fur family transcriptional regulator [Candidatus Aminicenantales bacterium]